MSGPILLDTGPLVAYLNRRDTYHLWAKTYWKQVSPPLLTCESVISEGCFLLNRSFGHARQLMELLNRDILRVAFRLEDQIGPVTDLMRRYADQPMSLADACLVRMAEIYSDSTVWTTDGDFRRYRKNGRRIIPVALPPQ